MKIQQIFSRTHTTVIKIHCISCCWRLQGSLLECWFFLGKLSLLLINIKIFLFTELKSSCERRVILVKRKIAHNVTELIECTLDEFNIKSTVLL